MLYLFKIIYKNGVNLYVPMIVTATYLLLLQRENESKTFHQTDGMISVLGEEEAKINEMQVNNSVK